MIFKLSYLNSNLALTLGYLNPALNNSALLGGLSWNMQFIRYFLKSASAYAAKKVGTPSWANPNFH